jgi:DNA (cytosine-5)-methyltransferase 1
MDKDEMQSYVPEFAKSAWSKESLFEIDFSDTTASYKWLKAGIAWKGSFISGSVYPTPSTPISSSLIDIVERKKVSRRYYLTANAAEGILRRVDNQGRKLFMPLRRALELEKAKK